MKVVTWNVNSLNARAEFVQRYLDAERPDVLAMQELKLPDERVPREIFTSRGYDLVVHGQKQYNGVAIASLRPITASGHGLPGGDEDQSRLCWADIDGRRFVNLYCPQGASVDSDKFAYKLRFYDALIGWVRANATAATVVLGDLNIAPEARDIWDPVAMEGVPSFHPAEHARWRELVGLGFEDVVRDRVPARTFSFWDYRGIAFRNNEGMRIDHVLMTAALAAHVRGAGVSRAWRKKLEGLAASDHAPVWVDLAD